MTPEPDFDQIARAMLQMSQYDRLRISPGPSMETYIRDVAAQLRQVWNARGAADLDAMETAHANYNWTELEDALRSLDR